MQTVGELSQALVGTVVPTPVLSIAYSDSILRRYARREVLVTTGDNLNILHKLTQRGRQFSIPSTAVVVSRIISSDRLTVYTTEIAQLSTQAQANWDKSIINIQLSGAITETIKTGNPTWIGGRATAILETQIHNVSKQSYFTEVILQLGTIV